MSEANSSDSGSQVNKNKVAKTAAVSEHAEAVLDLSQRSAELVGGRAAGDDDPGQATLLYGREGVFGGGSLAVQAARLTDPRLSIVQRQMLATQIGRVQDNTHLQKVIGFINGEYILNRPKLLPNATCSEGIDQNKSLSIQRFSPEEHQQLGAEATGNATLEIDLGDGTKLTYSEMVAMGDFFGGVAEIKALAKSPEGKAELRWTRWWAFGGKGSEPEVDQSIKDKVRNRYYKLAANNISHFSGGGTTRNKYQEEHEKALESAFLAGVNENLADWSDALITEAFANHFLTDMFSAGHVRTPRQEIKEWYEAQFPDSVGQFVSYTADWMTNNLDEQEEIPDWLPHDKVSYIIGMGIKKFGGSALKSSSIGDIVSLAYHNQDNKGLGVISDVDPDGNEVSDGYRWTAKGDNYLGESEITKRMAVAATNTSLHDLTLARQAGLRLGGGTRLSNEQIKTGQQTAIKNLQPFAAERYIPREDPEAGNVVMNWKWGKLDDVLRAAVDNEMKTTVANTLDNKKDGLPEELSIPSPHWVQLGLLPENMKSAEFAKLHVRDAFTEYCKHLAAEGINVVAIILGSSPS